MDQEQEPELEPVPVLAVMDQDQALEPQLEVTEVPQPVPAKEVTVVLLVREPVTEPNNNQLEVTVEHKSLVMVVLNNQLEVMEDKELARTLADMANNQVEAHTEVQAVPFQVVTEVQLSNQLQELDMVELKNQDMELVLELELEPLLAVTEAHQVPQLEVTVVKEKTTHQLSL